ncbi:fasciclin domain-containing protein [Mariniphaga sp.]|uniref:fasciclin domain-containing protein n=1 Tax=Mariniphaga sp. TaxID=1954475 RepID=UPI003564C347
MKKITYILSLLLVVVFYSCERTPIEANFEDVEKFSIYDYLMENKEQFSSFISILEKGNLDKTLSAYNPDGTNYTLFLPDNQAVNKFIEESPLFSSLNDILNNSDYAAAFSRYHVVNMGVHTNQFPFGAFSEPTLSEDFLTVSFVIETDTSYYRINNQASVIYPNIEVSNGYIHLIETALKPVTTTSYQWLEQNPGYSIFKDAVDLTGLQHLIDFNLKEDETLRPVTLLVEPDRIYNQNGVSNVNDLAALISPNDNNYTSATNPLYNYVAYHILSGQYFIDNFEGESTNYITFSEIPLNINGLGIDIAINKAKEDTIIGPSGQIIDYIGFFYDESNVITQSGAIHFIDRIMKQRTPSRSNLTFEFYEEPLLNNYRLEPGNYLIEDSEALINIQWSGADLFFIELGEQESSAWGADYLEINGDFIISYTTPRIIQGRYRVLLRAEAFNAQNALVEVFLDGKKIGSLVDLTTGGSSNSPFQTIELGTVDFKRYATHVVEVRPLIPGRFLWDFIRFEPF